MSTKIPEPPFSNSPVTSPVVWCASVVSNSYVLVTDRAAVHSVKPARRRSNRSVDGDQAATRWRHSRRSGSERPKLASEGARAVVQDDLALDSAAVPSGGGHSPPSSLDADHRGVVHHDVAEHPPGVPLTGQGGWSSCRQLASLANPPTVCPLADPSAGRVCVVAIIGFLLFGALIGALARAIRPGRQDLSGSATIIIGLLGAGTVGTVVGGITDGWFRFAWQGPSIIGSVLGATGFLAFAEWWNRRMRAQTQPRTTRDLVAGGENARVEFKGSARYNIHTRDKDARLELAIARSIAGFANTAGGTLLIGVDDDGQPIGLDRDLRVVKGGDLDRYELWLHDLFERCLGRSVLRLFDVTFDDLDGHTVCRIDVAASDTPLYLRPHVGEKQPLFYVRTGNSTRQLAVDDAVDYINRQWPPRTLARAGVAGRQVWASLRRHP